MGIGTTNLGSEAPSQGPTLGPTRPWIRLIRRKNYLTLDILRSKFSMFVEGANKGAKCSGLQTAVQ